jgi:hypothetical protein
MASQPQLGHAGDDDPSPTETTTTPSVATPALQASIIDAAGRGNSEKVRSLAVATPSLVNARGQLEVTPLIGSYFIYNMYHINTNVRHINDDVVMLMTHSRESKWSAWSGALFAGNGSIRH